MTKTLARPSDSTISFSRVRDFLGPYAHAGMPPTDYQHACAELLEVAFGLPGHATRVPRSQRQLAEEYCRVTDDLPSMHEESERLNEQRLAMVRVGESTTNIVRTLIHLNRRIHAAIDRSRAIEGQYAAARARLHARPRRAAVRMRPTARRCRASRRARVVARIAAKTTSTGDPDGEPAEPPGDRASLRAVVGLIEAAARGAA